MLCGSDPKRNDSWTLRVDVPSLRFGVVVRVNLHFCAGNVVPAILDVENRADLGRERPAVAFPCAGQPEGFRRDRAGEPYGASYWPLAGYGMLFRPLPCAIPVEADAVVVDCDLELRIPVCSVKSELNAVGPLVETDIVHAGGEIDSVHLVFCLGYGMLNCRNDHHFDRD